MHAKCDQVWSMYSSVAQWYTGHFHGCTGKSLILCVAKNVILTVATLTYAIQLNKYLTTKCSHFVFYFIFKIYFQTQRTHIHTETHTDTRRYYVVYMQENGFLRQMQPFISLLNRMLAKNSIFACARACVSAYSI